MNKENHHTIARIIFSILWGKCDLHDREILEQWQSQKQSRRFLVSRLTQPRYLKSGLQVFTSFDSFEGLDTLKREVKRRKRSRMISRIASGAAVILLAVTALLLYPNRGLQEEENHLLTTSYNPGASKARLLLPDGTQLDLSSQTTASQGDFRISGYDFSNTGEELSYYHPADMEGEENEINHHILQVPRGGEYRLVLPDGTRVWLNADSEIRFPGHFRDRERRVWLTGEAYFEVVKNTEQPFIVETQNMKTQVTGTAFNVSAYPGEDSHTTLLSGGVVVRTDDQNIPLKPGMQVLLTAKGSEVHSVVAGDFISWKDKRFAYRNRTFQDITRELERWYDVKIAIPDQQVAQERLTVNLPKYEKMDKVLEILSDIACVKFIVTNEKITVLPDK